MLVGFFLFIPFAAAAPTEPPHFGSSNTALKYAGGPTSPKTTPRTVVRHKAPPEAYKALVSEISASYGVSESEMMRVISCENKEWSTTAQSRHQYKAGNRWGFPEGTREKSYGLVQIHLPDHPSITYEQATDPVFAITFMAKKFSEGRQRMWSCY